MNNSTIIMVAALAAVAILAAAVVVVPIQQVSAQNTNFIFNKGIARSSGFAISSNIQSNCFSASSSVTC